MALFRRPGVQFALCAVLIFFGGLRPLAVFAPGPSAPVTLPAADVWSAAGLTERI